MVKKPDPKWPVWYGPKRPVYVDRTYGEPLLYPVIPNKRFLWGHKGIRARGTYVVLPRPKPVPILGS